MRTLAALLLLSAPLVAADPPAYKVLAADRGKLAIMNAKGEVEWEFPVKHDVHDLHVLPNGNFLTHTSATTTVEIEPKKKEIVWKYESKPKEGYKGRVEVHALQRLENGDTMTCTPKFGPRQMRVGADHAGFGVGGVVPPGVLVPAAPHVAANACGVR